MDVASLRVRFTGDTSGMDRAFSSANTKITNFQKRNAQRPKITPTFDTRAFDKKLNEMKKKLSDMTFKVVLDADVSKAQQKAEALGAYISSLDSDIGIGANTKSALAKVKTLQSNLGKLKAEIPVSIDTKDAEGKAAALKKTLDSLRAEIKVHADAGQAKKELIVVKRMKDDLAGDKAVIPVGVSGSAGAMTEMMGLQAMADKVAKRRELIFKVDKNIGKVLPNALGNINQQLQQFDTITQSVSAIKLPMFITAAGGAATAATVLAGAATSLVYGLGQGLAGAVGIGATAVGIGGAALGVYGAAMMGAAKQAASLKTNLVTQESAVTSAASAVQTAKQAVNDAKPGTQEYALAVQELSAAEAKLAEEERKLALLRKMATPEMMKLGDTIRSAQMKWTGFAAAITSEAAPALEKFITTGTSYLPQMQPHIVQMVGGMNKVALSFLEAAQKGQNMRSITEVLMGIKQAGAPALGAVTNAALILVNAIRPIVPYALRLVNHVNQLSAAEAKWTASAEGQTRMAQIWATLAQRGQQLWNILTNIASSVAGVFAALNNSGTVDRMMIGLNNVTSVIRTNLSETGRWRQAITDFMVTAQPILTAVFNLGKTIASEFFRVVNAIVGMKNAGTDVNTLVTVFEGLEGAVKPVADLLIRAFKDLGPQLGPLIQNVTEFMTTFAAGTPILTTYVGIINRVLSVFNSLPESMKLGIGQLLALSMVLGTLSGSGVGGILGFAGNMTSTMLIMGQLRAQTAALTGATQLSTAALIRQKVSLVASKVATAATTAATWAAQAAQWAWNAAMTANPIGIVVVAIAALVAALVLAYMKCDWFRNLVNKTFALLKVVAVANLNLLWNAMKAVWNWVATTAPAVWNGLKNFVVGAINGIKAVIDRVFPGLRTTIQTNMQIVKTVLLTAWNIIKATTTQVWNGIKIYFGGVWKVIKGIFTGNLGLIKQGLVQMWAGMRIATSAAWRGVQALLRVVWAGIKAIFSNTLNWLGQFVKQRFNAMVATVRGWGTQIRNVVTQAWNNVKNSSNPIVRAVAKFVENTFRTMVTFVGNQLQIARATVQRIWAIIRATTTQVWNGIKNFFSGVWKVIRGIFTGDLGLIRRGVQQAWTGIRQITTAVWNGIKALFQTIWAAIKATFNNALNAVRAQVSNVWNTIKRISQTIWNGIKAMFSSTWNAIKNIFDSAMNAIRSRIDSWGRNTRSAFTSLGNWAKNMWDSFWKFLRNLWDTGFRAIGDRVSSWVNATRGRFSDFGNWAKNMWSGFWKNLREMFDSAFTWLGDRARTWGNAMKSLFERIRGWLVNPIETARDALKAVWNSILGGVGKVLSAVGMKDLAKKVEGAKWATGGTTEDKASVQTFAKGGMGTKGRKPRMHLWNEQQGGEAFIAERRPAKEQLPYLQTAAGWHDYAVVPANPEKAGVSAGKVFEKGGLAIRAFAGGGIEAMYNAVKDKFGVAGFNRHGSYLSGRAALDSLDFMVTTPGSRAGGAQKTLGDNIAKYTQPPSAVNTIWYGQANFGNGWQGYSTGPGVGNANTLGHYDHVHAQAFPGSFRGGQGGGMPGGGGGGFSLPNPLQILFEKVWKTFVKPLFVKAEETVDGAHVLRQGGADVVKQIRHGIYKFIDDKIPDTIGGGDGGVSGNFTGSQKEMALTFAKNAVKRGIPGRLPVMTALVESGMKNVNYGDRDSLGYFQQRPSQGWGTPAQIMDPAYSLDKFLDGAMQYKGQYGNNPTGLGNWAQAVQRSAFPDRYAQQWNPAGDLIGDPKYYARGGQVPGVGPVKAVLHGGERVLTAKTNIAFEKLADAVTVWAKDRRYQIRWGDTLSELAARFDTTVKRLMQLNPQIRDADKIFAGGMLNLPAVGAAPPKPFPKDTPTPWVKQGVKLGERNVGGPATTEGAAMGWSLGEVVERIVSGKDTSVEARKVWQGRSRYGGIDYDERTGFVGDRPSDMRFGAVGPKYHKDYRGPGPAGDPKDKPSVQNNNVNNDVQVQIQVDGANGNAEEIAEKVAEQVQEQVGAIMQGVHKGSRKVRVRVR